MKKNYDIVILGCSRNGELAEKGVKTMPIYEYKCKGCTKRFEMLQRISDEPLKECIYCGGIVEKLISNSAFQFKGSGWYVTDYKNKGIKTQSNTDKIDSSPIKDTGTNKNATINK